MKATQTEATITEHTPLLGDQVSEAPPLVSSDDVEHSRDAEPPAEEARLQSSKENNINFLSILALLLIGVFVANADTSLVLATYGRVSSEFNSLENASWLLTGYMLSMCGSQPLYGKLSNIFGRKVMLLLAYGLFAIGNLICGLADSMAVVILGRIIGGAGGAGMSSVVSFLIADMVPLRDVATYRSYVNIVQTVGRSCGGPLGGWMAEAMGWRWSFLVQVPLTALAFVLVSLRLKTPKPTFKQDQGESTMARLRRVDSLGAFLMCTTIVVFLLPISMGGNQLPWKHPAIGGLFAMSLALAGAFSYVELRLAKEPIFPLTLLTRQDVVIPYAILFFQNIAQTFMMFVVPLYFQVTANATPSSAGFYLVPAVVGNTVGGLATGAYIKRSGRYKSPMALAAVVAGLCHTLLALRWTGHTGILEAMYIFPGGIGTGIAHSSTFVAITAGTTDEELAIAGGGLYLCGGFGSVLGVTVASSALRVIFKRVASANVGNDPAAKRVIEKALADIGFIDGLKGKLREAILDAYVWGFRANFALALLCCFSSLVLGLFMKEKRFA